ncbi:pentatricopeptide repeat-containing protein At2g15690, mitochondrial-like [Populus nigra]|uniref:pentatricopeptide repeat-containing protein At2g15690, mitochondrial-like n=1 Tax=Populus nigra TaxID=3691 RepID=UPI002B270A4A|nr:pentatricopeptide repeat-containing protein At2g15690, mitochondrial-like [Populus nigra]
MGGDQNVSADYGRFVALLDSSANLKSLEPGIEALELLKRSPFAFDVQLNNQLVEMHANAEMDAGVDGLLFVEEMKKGYGCSPSRRLSLAVFMTCACAGAVLLRGCHLSPRLRVNRHFARIHGDHELENRVEELLVTPDPSEGNDNKVPFSPRKKYNASDMLAEKSRVAEYQCPKPYEGEGYEMLKGLNGQTRKLVMFQILDM